MSDTWRERVNIPLLRKGVEWVEEQASLSDSQSQWIQNSWVTPESDRVEQYDAASGCGSAYCFAGWVAAQRYPELADQATAFVNGQRLWSEDVAANELGLPNPYEARAFWKDGMPSLFHPRNTSEDIRRIAEELAGEKL